MHNSYDDIMDALTTQLRRSHYFHYLYMDEGHEGAHPDCKTFSYDVLGKVDEHGNGDRCCSCVPVPLWWDESGTPRFAEHHPKHCPDIYADEVALFIISCQACGETFRVQASWSYMGDLGRVACAIGVLERRTDFRISSKQSHDLTAKLKEGSLREAVKNGSIHYGDPPFHTGPSGHVCSGATMNCWDLRVLEFWQRISPIKCASCDQLATYRCDNAPPTCRLHKSSCCREVVIGGFERVAELEIELPDAKDPERLNGPDLNEGA